MPNVLTRFATAQLRRPSGLFGRWVLPRLWNRHNRALNDDAFAALAPAPGERILEVGFGGGYLLARLAEAVGAGALAGADASAAVVAHGRRRFRRLLAGGRLSLECAEAERLPFPAGAFDKTCSVNSIFYWNDPPKALAELARVTRPGGSFVLVFTDDSSFDGRAAVRAAVARMTVEEVRQMASRAGYVAIDTTSRADRHRRFWVLAGRKAASG